MAGILDTLKRAAVVTTGAPLPQPAVPPQTPTAATPQPAPAAPRPTGPQMPPPSAATGPQSLLNSMQRAGGSAIAPATPAGARPAYTPTPQRPATAVPPGGMVRQTPAQPGNTAPPTVPSRTPATYSQYTPGGTISQVAAAPGTPPTPRPRTSQQWLADPQARYGPSGQPNPAMAFSSGPSIGSQVSGAVTGGLSQASRAIKGLGGTAVGAALAPVTVPMSLTPRTNIPALEAGRTFGQSMVDSTMASAQDLGSAVTGLSPGPNGLQWEAPGQGLGHENIPASYRDRMLADQHTLGGSSDAVRAAGGIAGAVGDTAAGAALGGPIGRFPGLTSLPGRAVSPLVSRITAPILSRSPAMQQAAGVLARPGVSTAINTVGIPAAAVGASMASPAAGQALSAAYPTLAAAGPPTPNTPAEQAAGPIGGLDMSTPLMPDGTPARTPEQQAQLVETASTQLQNRLKDPGLRTQAADYVQRMQNGEPVDETLVAQNATSLAEQTGEPPETVMQTLSQMGWPEHIAMWGGLGLGALGLISGMSGGGLGSWLLAVLGGALGLGGAAAGGLLGDGAQSFVQDNLINPIREQIVGAALPGQIESGKQQITDAVQQTPGWQRALGGFANRYLGTSFGQSQGQQQIEQALAPYANMLSPEQMQQVRSQLSQHLNSQLGIGG